MADGGHITVSPGLALLKSVRGVWVPLSVLTFVGSGSAALMLSQLMFLLDADPTGEVTRPDHAWEDDLGLSAKQARQAREHLASLGLVKVAKRRVNGAPTTCIALDFDGLDRLVATPEGVKSICPNGQMRFAQTGGTTVLPTVKNNPPNGGSASAPQNATKRAHQEAAHAIATAVWERKKPRPAQKFVAVRSVAEALLAAGHLPKAVEDAMVAARTISIGWCEAELNKPRTPNVSPVPRLATSEGFVARDAPEGVLKL